MLIEVAADVETLCFDEDCCALVALGSESANGEGVEEWVEKDGGDNLASLRARCSVLHP